MTSRQPVEIIPLGLPQPGNALARSTQDGVTIFGHPYVDHVPITHSPLASEIVSNPSRYARSLDGEFCVVVETPDQLLLISDRYVSLPLFYAAQGDKFAFSFSYTDLWNWLRTKGILRPDKFAFYEFLKFQKLFGERTFDKSSKLLPPATVLTFDKNTRKITKNKYWSPSFEKQSGSISDIAAGLAEAVKHSVAAKSRGFNDVGLLLSGGMDSRVVLGGFDQANPPNTFTVGTGETLEVMVAQELAMAAGAPHHFLLRNPNHYANILPTAAALGGSMYSYQHGHFFDFTLPIQTDLLMHGHGLDYMFQGMYLPARRRSFMGRQTNNYRLTPPVSVVDEYLVSAKYMLKGIDPENLLRQELITNARESIRDSIDGQAREIQDTAVDTYDVWDYLTFGWPGRHYTNLNLLSAGTLASQQTVAWDNAIFDQFYATPADIRFGTQLLAETTQILRPELLKVRNANTNLSPKLTGTGLTLANWKRSLLRRTRLSRPDIREIQVGSWPRDNQILRESETLSERARQLSISAPLLDLELFDQQALKRLVGQFESGHDHLGSVILTMLTIDTFLSAAP